MILFVIILLLEENFYMTSKNFSLFLKKGVGISFEKTLEGIIKPYEPPSKEIINP